MTTELKTKKTKEISPKLKYFLKHAFKAYFEIEYKKRLIQEINEEISVLEKELKRVKRKSNTDLKKVREFERKISSLKSKVKKLNKEV